MMSERRLAFLKKYMKKTFIITIAAIFLPLLFLKSSEASCSPDGALIMARNGYKVYRIVNCQKEWIETYEEFISRGYSYDNVEKVDQSIVDFYIDYQDEKRTKLIKANNSPMVYYITEFGAKRHIPTMEIFNSYGNKWEDVAEFYSDYLEQYEFNDLIKLEGDYKVYKLIGGIKYWIENIELFNQLELAWDKIAPVNQTEFDYYENGGSISNFYADARLSGLLAQNEPDLTVSDYEYFQTMSSPYDGRIAVLFGERGKCCSYPIGLFFMNNDFELESNYVILDGDTTHRYLDNVNWVSAKSVNYDLITTDEGGSRSVTYTIIVDKASANFKNRDSRRIADLAIIQLAEEIYYDVYGHYAPNLSDLVDERVALSSLPTDPLDGSSYAYCVDDSGSDPVYIGYVIGTMLEETNSELMNNSVMEIEIPYERSCVWLGGERNWKGFNDCGQNGYFCVTP
jgi:hypothetical protein